MKGVKVLAAPRGASAAPRDMLATLCGMLATLHSVLAALELQGGLRNPGGLLYMKKKFGLELLKIIF